MPDPNTDPISRIMAAFQQLGQRAATVKGVAPPPTLQGQLQPSATPAPEATPDPYAQAVVEAQSRYPWLKTLGVPIKLTTGKGPFMSESYPPHDDHNPYPGNFTVQLRNPKLVDNPEQWPAALGREGMDYMARFNPTYQNYAKQFRHLMTPPQLKMARNRYEKEGDRRSFEDYLKGAELQEFIGGYIFDMGDWRKNAGYTPEQKKLLDGLSKHMWQGQTPVPVNIP